MKQYKSLQPQLSDCKVKFSDRLEINSVRQKKIGTPFELRHLFFQRIESAEEIKIILVRNVFFPKIIRRFQITREITLKDFQISFLPWIVLAKIMCSQTPLGIQLQTVRISLFHNSETIFRMSEYESAPIIAHIFSIPNFSDNFSESIINFSSITQNFKVNKIALCTKINPCKVSFRLHYPIQILLNGN